MSLRKYRILNVFTGDYLPPTFHYENDAYFHLVSFLNNNPDEIVTGFDVIEITNEKTEDKN